MNQESTRALVIGLFVVTGRAELTAAELVQLGRCRGVSPSNLKSHLTRMVQDGSLVRRGGRRSFLYSPSSKKRHVIDAIRTRLAPAEERWNGDWILFVPDQPSERARRDRLRRRLAFDGFRPLGPAVFARPAWPRAWARARTEAHVERNGGAFVIGPLAGTSSDLLRSYDIESLARRAKQLGERVARALSAPPTGRRALALQLDLGEQIARLFALDPRLPPELWGDRPSLAALGRAHARLRSVLARASAPFLASVLGASIRERTRKTA